MNRWQCCIGILLVCLGIFGLPVRGEEPPPLAELETMVKSMMEKGDIPGLCLVIVRGDEVPYVKGFGYADLEEKIPVTAETMFELASCSKAFTGLGLLKLEQEGLVHTEDPVSRYLPWFETEFEGKKQEITLEQLLHHTSGIPANTIALIPRSGSKDALEQTVRALSGITLRHAPGKQYEYATVNYDILGLIIREVSGKNFEEYMESQIFTPLGLSRNTRVGAPGDNPLMATGYKIGFSRPLPYRAPQFRGNNPAAYIVSNGNDMARWLRIQLGLLETGLSPLISRSHEPDLSVNPDQTNFTSYAAGWIVYQFKNRVLYHSGLNPNFTSFISIDPGMRLGVALLANSNSNYSDHIGKNIMNLLSGRKENPNPPAQNKVDLVGIIMTLLVGFYVLCVLAFILLRLIAVFRGKTRYEPFTWQKRLKSLGSVLLGIPYLLGVYLLPSAVGGLNWDTVFVWAPLSITWAVVLVGIAFFVSYLLYFLSLLFPAPNKYLSALPLIAALGMLSGIANTGVLFIITTAFFSPLSLGYLLYYFLMTYSIFLLGTKIVSTKMIKLTNDITLDLRERLVETLIASRFQQFEHLQDGRIFTTLNADTAVLAGSAGMVIGLITSIITAVSAFAYLATISFVATLVVLGVVFILAGYYHFVSKVARVFMEEARDTQNVYMGLLNGLIQGFKQLAIHRNKRIDYKDDLLDSCRLFRDKNIIARIKFLNSTLIGNSFIMIILGILSIVVPRVATSVKTITLISFVMVLLYLIGPVNGILRAIPGITTIRVSWDRIKDFLKDLELDGGEQTFKGLVRMLDRPVDKEIKALVRFHPGRETVESLKVENITFEYAAPEESERFRIGPIDFELKKGDVLFLVGGNGSGKTTLAHVLTGLYHPGSGCIKIDDRETESDYLGEYFSTIYSNFHLFEKLYAVDASEKEEEVEEYLERLRLEEKVQLDVEENAFTTLNLSGGQRKRLALLQCYLENRPIYLFDEMAADQDPEFKRFFYTDLLVRMKEQGKIVIAITHDDHYFDTADYIIKMEDGKVEYKGSGQSLDVRQFLWGPKKASKASAT